MAIYSCRISNVSRKKGSSSLASLAYISGLIVSDELTGQRYNYSRKERVEYVNTLLPDNAPERYSDPAVLFNELEQREKASDARIAKKIMVALPREFDEETQREVIEEFIKVNFIDKGYPATYAIHSDKKNNNPHAHIMVANRAINKNGAWASKQKSVFALDEEGNRIPVIDPVTGKQKERVRKGKGTEKLWKRINVEVNILDQKDTLKEIRKSWADECNKRLGEGEQIDHRSYAEQGIEKIPTIHEGYAAREIEKRGEHSNRVAINHEINAINSQLTNVQSAIKQLAKKYEEIKQITTLITRQVLYKLLEGGRSLRQIFTFQHVQDQTAEFYKASTEEFNNAKNDEIVFLHTNSVDLDEENLSSYQIDQVISDSKVKEDFIDVGDDPLDAEIRFSKAEQNLNEITEDNTEDNSFEFNNIWPISSSVGDDDGIDF